MEMDSIYPRRFRYSPDRPKNVLSGNKLQILLPLSYSPLPVYRCLPACSSSWFDLFIFVPRVDPSGSAEPRSDWLQDADGGNREDDRLPEETCEQVLMTSLPVPLQTPTEENPDPEPPSGPDTSCRTSEDLNPERPDTPSSAPDPVSKPPSSGESSEDEEEVKGGPEEGKTSILPSSVLDRASAIAQHFSIRRGSPARGQGQQLLRSLRDLQPGRPEPSVSSGGNRRDSTLSQQDQMLIGKIRNYYENQDLSFKLQRRESLNYIPAGLVRTSVSRLNSTTDQQPNTESGPLTDQQTSTESAPLLTLSGSLVTLWARSGPIRGAQIQVQRKDPGPDLRAYRMKSSDLHLR
ncbi:hypothetical protein F7725_020074 [Dissostichus mawsoni]|uniref:Uncharacterized protein n=1 Tax=Dissostichus mawsoni TaxID=36200 RepID=A0A7J5YLN8_DISMA|nr:hypothetical protein F7725_020074 [Dissostichus mawsoni]